MIPQAFIQDLLARVDIVEVVGRAVRLRKAGANMVGLCPFHGEKTPSFTVSPAKQFYHCFGCQANGSAIGFLMAHAGLGFVEAVTELAQGQGLVVPHEGRGPENPPARPGLGVRLEQAAAFYQRRLRDAPAAIAYLKGRGLSGRTAARFGMGFAPPGWRNLEAVAADYDDPAWEEVGLVKFADDADTSPASRPTSEPRSPPADSLPPEGSLPVAGAGTRRRRYDRFRNRIMFPIRNLRGAVIGFGGRVLASGEPKYLNSPETPLFQKGRELYGLYEAQRSLRETNAAVVVEGYLDVVMLAEHGIGNAVATLGTATTEDHIRKLLRLVDRIVFSFDGDSAGRKAAWRALQATLPIVADTQSVAFLFLPEGADPDSFVREHGRDGWVGALETAVPLSGFLFEGLVRGLDMASPEGRAAFLARARPVMQTLVAPGLRLQLAHHAADLARIGMAELESFMVADPPPGTASARTSGQRARGPDRQGGFGMRGSSGPGRTTAPQKRQPGALARASRPSLERRLRLLAVCQPGLCASVHEQMDVRDCPAALRRWFDDLAGLPAGASSAAALERLALAGHHDAHDLAETRQDLACQWSGIPALTHEESRLEFLGAVGQLERRAARQAARELVAQGLRTDDERQIHRELLASRR